ncbi:hypothetical protein D3C86_2167460 [compost metagenome]
MYPVDNYPDEHRQQQVRQKLNPAHRGHDYRGFRDVIEYEGERKLVNFVSKRHYGSCAKQNHKGRAAPD